MQIFSGPCACNQLDVKIIIDDTDEYFKTLACPVCTRRLETIIYLNDDKTIDLFEEETDYQDDTGI